MMIGELINKFDNETQGTVKEFNEIFPFAKLDKGNYVEILEPVLGKEFIRIIEVDGKQFEHNLKNYNKKDIQVVLKDKKTRKVTKIQPLFLYTASKDGVTKEFNSIKELSIFVNRSRTAVWDRLNAGYSKNIDGWLISKVDLKEE